jgi:hypothetical protein
MSSHHATREAARTRFLEEMGEATSDAEHGQVILSMVEVVLQTEYTGTLQQAIHSLLDIYQTSKRSPCRLLTLKNASAPCAQTHHQRYGDPGLGESPVDYETTLNRPQSTRYHFQGWPSHLRSC